MSRLSLRAFVRLVRKYSVPSAGRNRNPSFAASSHPSVWRRSKKSLREEVQLEDQLFDELKSKQLRTQGISRQSTFFSLGNIADCKEVQVEWDFGERASHSAPSAPGCCPAAGRSAGSGRGLSRQIAEVGPAAYPSCCNYHRMWVTSGCSRLVVPRVFVCGWRG